MPGDAAIPLVTRRAPRGGVVILVSGLRVGRRVDGDGFRLTYTYCEGEESSASDDVSDLE